MNMDKEDLATEIYYELDFIRLVADLAEFAIMNGAKINIDTYALIFWDLHKRSHQIAELVEKLHNFENTSAASQKNNPNSSP